MAAKWRETAKAMSAQYDEKFNALEATGFEVHGEADFVETLRPKRVLDAGCGTGRVAIRLAERRFDVVGVDRDAAMLSQARSKAPDVAWVEGDLADVDVRRAQADDRAFDVIIMAGNVMIFIDPQTEVSVVANMARHLAPGGALVAGFQLGPARLTLEAYDAAATAAGLELTERYSTWSKSPFTARHSYAVSVHRSTSTEAALPEVASASTAPSPSNIPAPNIPATAAQAPKDRSEIEQWIRLIVRDEIERARLAPKPEPNGP